MLTGKNNQYFWHVTSFVALTIIVNAGGTSEGAFEVAMARLEENATGILIYTLIAVFLWPRNSMSELKESSRKLFTIQSRLYRTYCELMGGRDTAEEVQPLRMQEAALLPKVGQTLEAAESDSHEVFALRDQWRNFHHLSMTLRETLESWRQSFPEIQSLDLPGLLPNLEPFLSELDLRFEATERLLTGEKPTRLPSAISLSIDRDKTHDLSPFQRAAVVLTKTDLERLESLSQSLFDCVLDLSEDRPPVSIPPQGRNPARRVGHRPGPSQSFHSNGDTSLDRLSYLGLYRSAGACEFYVSLDRPWAGGLDVGGQREGDVTAVRRWLRWCGGVLIGISSTSSSSLDESRF